MTRQGFEFKRFYIEKKKHKQADGIHCVIPGCQNLLTSRQKKYCSDNCYRRWVRSLHLQSWDVVRANVINRDGKCMDCGTKDPQPISGSERWGFEVHHIKPISEGGDEFDMDNLVTLCVKCHIERHRKKYNISNMKITDTWSIEDECK